MTVFITWPFKATGGTTGRTMPDRLADVINVKDYGATGDGVTNDTAAIQAAFNAAFGTSAAPHGSSNSQLNKPVFFPNGNYILNSGLTLTDVYGGHIYGGSMGATILQANAVLSAVLGINGMANCLVENLQFINSGKSSSNGTTGIDLDWSGTSTSVGLSNNQFFKILIANAQYGTRICKSGSSGGAATLLTQVSVTNCYYGTTLESSATNLTMIGGGPSGCNVGTLITKGDFSTIGAGGASSLQVDIQLDSGGNATLIGTRSEAANHVSISNGNYTAIALDHNSAFAGYSANLTSSSATATFVNSALGTNGISNSGCITGSAGNLFVRGTTFNCSQATGPLFLSSFSGTVREVIGAPITFSQLPSSNNAGEGLQFNLTDGNSTTWGGAVTASSNKHVLTRWNSTGWTVVGN